MRFPGPWWLLVGFLLHISARSEDPVPYRTRVFVSGTGGYHTYRIPALSTTSQGTLLAFAEGRRNGGADAGDIDLLLRRSRDGGQSWESVQTVWDDGPNTCGNPCPVLDRETGTIWLLLTWNRGDDHETDIIAQRSTDTRRVFVARSTDDGVTWSQPREITASTKLTNWTWYATGPGAGIQLERGPRRGRLMIPCDHIEAGTRRYFSHVIYSDDHGATWSLGGSTPKDQVNECEVAELADGRLLLNMRNYDPSKKTRQQAISADGGKTWTDQQLVPELVEPICQASLRRMAWPTPNQPGVLLFSNPASTRRERLTVRANFDEGRTWPKSKLVENGPSAYSCLTRLANGEAGLLYETGDKGPYEALVFARFPVGWVTDRVTE
ncbi:MAG: exo-alpha-sialidase [Verrucomicrobiales bacterium]|nr:exo-alpha-sialidase [Verrucomicrobiales bacterium]